jgi:Flp pilus assembly protein TadG
MVRSQPRAGVRGGTPHPRGAAAVELAFLLPFICYLGMATVDYARLFYATTTITNCAWNAANWAACQANSPTSSPFTSLTSAAQADAVSLPNSISVARVPASGTLTDANGNSYVGATVSYTFTTVINYPGIPYQVPLSQTVYMPVHP